MFNASKSITKRKSKRITRTIKNIMTTIIDQGLTFRRTSRPLLS